jgi:hypothetical protein
MPNNILLTQSINRLIYENPGQGLLLGRRVRLSIPNFITDLGYDELQPSPTIFWMGEGFH